MFDDKKNYNNTPSRAHWFVFCIRLLHMATPVHVLLPSPTCRWPWQREALQDIRRQPLDNFIICDRRRVALIQTTPTLAKQHEEEKNNNNLTHNAKFTTKICKRKRKEKTKTCLRVDKHSGRRAREDRWDILFHTDRMLEEVALFLFRAACICSRWENHIGSVSVARSSLSDCRLHLLLCLNHRCHRLGDCCRRAEVWHFTKMCSFSFLLRGGRETGCTWECKCCRSCEKKNEGSLDD